VGWGLGRHRIPDEHGLIPSLVTGAQQGTLNLCVQDRPSGALIQTPGLGSLRSPNRASFTLAALCAVALAISLAWLFDHARNRWRRGVICGVAGVVLATNLLIPIHETLIGGGPALDAALRDVAGRARPGESLVEVPADCTGQTWTVLLQVIHQTPVVGCQTSPAAIQWESLELYRDSAALAALRCQPYRIGKLQTSFTRAQRFDVEDLHSLQRDFGARFFLIDTARLVDECGRVGEALPILERFERIGGDGRWIVIDADSPTGTGP